MKEFHSLSEKSVYIWKIKEIIKTIISLIFFNSLIFFLGNFKIIGQYKTLFYIFITIENIISFLIIFLLYVHFKYKNYKFRYNKRIFEIRRGKFFFKKTFIPIREIKSIIIKDNPLSRKFNVVSIEVSTIAEKHVLSYLSKDEAEKIRDFIIKENGE